jgi:ubiquinone/menaquinone biosynthesis C-methylase UbiE
MTELATWERLASRYDLSVKLFDQSYHAVGPLLERDLVGRRRLLEVAAGTGQFTPTLGRLVPSVLSTDLSPSMVAQLQARLGGLGLDHVQAQVMSAYDLQVEPSSFDALFCANALHIMEEPQRALAAFWAALAPGGLLVAPTFLHGADAWRRGLSRVLARVSPLVAHTRFDLTGLQAAVTSAGFLVKRAEQLPGLLPLGYVVALRT